MKKKLFYSAGAILCVLAIVLGTIKLIRVKEARQSGILLAFDDWYPEVWCDLFDLLDEYDVKVTFFINGYEPSEFCYEAQMRGHEIAFHGALHQDVTSMTEQELKELVIDPIETFKQQGFELSSFAYPEGKHDEETDELLLQHFKTLRGAWGYEVTSKATIRHGYIDAFPLDFHYYPLDKQDAFESRINGIMQELSNNEGAVISLYSHGIDGGAEWCISKERLEFIFRKAKEYNIKFYTFQELQKD